MKTENQIIKAYKTDRGNLYGFDFSLNGIRVRRQGFFSQAEAMAILIQIRLDIFKGHYEPEKYFKSVKNDLTIKTFWNKYYLPNIQKNLKKRTCKMRESHYKHHILPVCGETKIRAITDKKLYQIFEVLNNKGLASGTQKAIYTTISGLLRMAKKLGYIDYQPKIEIKAKLKREKKTLSRKESLAYLKVITNDYSIKEDYRHILQIIFWTGLRIGEALALKIEDINFKSLQMTISRQKGYGHYDITSTKTNKIYVIPIHPELLPTLRKVVAIARNNREGFLFLNDATDNIYSANLLLRACKKAGRKAFGKTDGNKMTLHTLRRSLASQLIDSNFPIDQVALLMRHDTKTLLTSYNSVNTKMFVEDFNKFNFDRKEAENNK